MAGIALTISIIYHIIHASFWLDFWSIWLNKEDVNEATTRFKRAIGGKAPAPRKAAKYPWDNKMYHTAIVLSALAVVPTGLFMMVRVSNPFFARNPYMFSDGTWGWMYVLHGLSGIGLVGLDDRAHLLRDSSGEALDHQGYGLRRHQQAGFPQAPRSAALGCGGRRTAPKEVSRTGARGILPLPLPLSFIFLCEN